MINLLKLIGFILNINNKYLKLYKSNNLSPVKINNINLYIINNKLYYVAFSDLNCVST